MFERKVFNSMDLILISQTHKRTNYMIRVRARMNQNTHHAANDWVSKICILFLFKIKILTIYDDCRLCFVTTTTGGALSVAGCKLSDIWYGWDDCGCCGDDDDGCDALLPNAFEAKCSFRKCLLWNWFESIGSAVDELPTNANEASEVWAICSSSSPPSPPLPPHSMSSSTLHSSSSSEIKTLLWCVVGENLAFNSPLESSNLSKSVIK